MGSEMCIRDRSWTTAAYTVNGTSDDFTNNGSTVLLTLDTAVADETQVRVAYSATGSLITDASNAENALAALSSFTVVNGTADSTAPTLTSASVDSQTLKLNFSEALQTTDTLLDSTFVIETSTDGGTTWTTAAYTVNGTSDDYTNNGSTVLLTLDTAVADETQVRVGYSATGNLITDASNAENAFCLLYTSDAADE